MIKQYSSGILLSSCKKYVALLKKEQPAFLAGNLNFPGGKREPNESSFECVSREILEETGVYIPMKDWAMVARLSGRYFAIDFFLSITDKVFEVQTLTNEQVNIYSVSDLFSGKFTNIEQPVLQVLALTLGDQIVFPVTLYQRD